VRSLFERINACLTDDTVVVADVGDALFGSADLFIHRRTEFLAPAYYTSMGFAVPASIGAQLANPKRRPLVLVGDGAFQMTGMELGTAVRNGLNPIVIVMNNHGYGTERHILDGPFNDVAPWRFHQLPQLFGAGRAWLVQTNGELDAALIEAAGHTREFCLIEVLLAPLDRSPALDRLANRLADRLKGKGRAS
jgi:indolepyruvate decarboxylase